MIIVSVGLCSIYVHRHHVFAQYAEMKSKICNVPDRKANSFSSNNCPYSGGDPGGSGGQTTPTFLSGGHV